MTTVICARASYGRVALIASFVGLPLLVGLGTVALGLAGLTLRGRGGLDPTSQVTGHHTSQDQVRAATLAKQYCARLTGATCDIDPAEVRVVSTHMPGQQRRGHEWTVYGRAGASRCLLCLDADTLALRRFTRESAFTSGESAHAARSASSDNGDVGTLSGHQEEQYARRYLTRSGIVLPRRAMDAQLVPLPFDKDSFCYDPDGGEACTIQVSIDPADGRLVLLANRTQRRSMDHLPAEHP
jgi:hypothetical protein